MRFRHRHPTLIATDIGIDFDLVAGHRTWAKGASDVLLALDDQIRVETAGKTIFVIVEVFAYTGQCGWVAQDQASWFKTRMVGK